MANNEELKIEVKGKEVPHHYSLTLTPDAAVAIRRFVVDFREQCQRERGFWGIREDEDEALEQLVQALDGAEEDDDPDGGVATLTAA